MKITVENQTIFRVNIKINDTKYTIGAKDSIIIDFFMPRRIKAGDLLLGYSNTLILDKNDSYFLENITIEMNHFIEKRWIFPVVGWIFIILHWVLYKGERSWITHFLLPIFILIASFLKIHIRFKLPQNPI